MKLNEQQSEIVGFPAGESCLVTAGPGSGKTTVIAHRGIAISKAISAGTTLQMLTFSNKASKEMKERVRRVGGISENIKYDTFHSFGLRLMKDDPEGFGLTEGFSLLSENDMRRSIRSLAKAHGMPTDLEPADKKRLDACAWLSTWSLAKQAGFNTNNPDNKKSLCERLSRAHQLDDGETDLAWKTLRSYEEDKRKSNSVDFDDLLYFPLLRLAQEPAFRSGIQAGIGHIMVDEAQDTNRIQYEIVKHIGHGHCGVTCVGDDDQSIYGWRGAEIKNMKRFVAQFGAKELRLEQNYRSTKSIVNSACDLIENNKDRLSKRPFADSADGHMPTAKHYCDSREMADAIASQVAGRIAAGVEPKEIAILYRTNRMALLLEQGLRRQRIPYHVVGGMSLFDRAEVTAVTSALRLAMNPKDTHAFRNLVPYIDGFGDASAYMILDAMKEDESLTISKINKTNILTPKANQALEKFVKPLMFDAVLKNSATEFVEWCIKGPMRIIEREKDDQLKVRRAQHLEALAHDIDEEMGERQQSEPQIGWRDVMMEVALRDARQSESEGQEITLSTIHRSKGLEWSDVIIAGVSEGLMPLDAREDVSDGEAGYLHAEEERRLAYVAVTRAKEHCTAYHADRYFFPGGQEDKTYSSSRFLDELGITIIKPTFSDSEDVLSNDGNDFFSQFTKAAGTQRMNN